MPGSATRISKNIISLLMVKRSQKFGNDPKSGPEFATKHINEAAILN